MDIYSVYVPQAIEKLVKGKYGLFVNAENVPHVHSITQLVKEFEDDLSEPVEDAYYDLFETLTAHYLSSRYPDFQRHLETITKEEKAREIYLKTKEVFAWLKTLKP